MDFNWKLLFQHKTLFLLLIFLTGISQTKGFTHTGNRADVAHELSLQTQLEGISLTYISYDESCPGKNDGSIDLTILNGGATPLIQWSNGETTEDLSGLAAGTYDVTVTDGSETASMSITIGNNPAPVASITGDAVVCQNSEAVPLMLHASGGIAPYVAHFTINGGLILKSNSFTDETPLFQSTTNVGTYHYELVSIVDDNDCEYPVSGEVTIEVTDGATLNNPGPLEFCQGEKTSAISLTGTPDNVVFDISGGASIGLSDKTGVSQIPSFTALTGSATLTITPYTAECTGTPQTVEVTVSSKPDLSVSPLTQTICSGETTDIKLSSSTAGTTFSWTVADVSPPGTISGTSSGDGQAINQTLVNNGTTEATVTYHLTANKDGCAGSSMNVTVHVRPAIQATIDATPSACQGDALPEVTFTASNGQAPYTFTYQINDGALQTISTTTGNSVSVVAGTGTPGSFDYELISVKDQTGCSSAINESRTVTINEKPVLTSKLTPQGICNNDLFSYTPTFSDDGTTYEWTRSEVSGIADPARTESGPIDEYLNNTTQDPIAVTYTITMTSPDGCTNTQDVVVMVTPMPRLTSSWTPDPICSGAVFSYEPESDVSGTEFPWTREKVDGISNPTASGSGNPNEILTNTTSKPIGVTYKYTLNSHDCVNPETFLVQVVVIPSPEVSVWTSEPEICPGESVNLFSSSSITSSASPSTLLDEDFEDGAANWTTAEDDSRATWTIQPNNYNYSSWWPSSDVTFSSNDNSNFYLINARPLGNSPWYATQSSSLTSPALNTVGYTSLSLNFWHYYADGTNQAKIRVSTDGVNWTTIETIIHKDGKANRFNQKTISLNSWVGQPTLYIQFYYQYQLTASQYYWAIDNVSITGEGSTANMYWTSNPAGFSSTLQNPTDVFPSQTTDYIVWYTDPDTGCLGSDTVTVTVRETPDPEITADYCSFQPYVRLCAPDGFASYQWQEFRHDGSTEVLGTNSCIDVDIAATYTVTVTDQQGCTGSSSFNTATELVENGDFELGEEGRSTFYTDYGFRQSSGFLGGGLYGIGKDARPYYTTFRGAHDHTSGSGYYMIVDGTESSKVVWQQTIEVEPNTDYYFSAWAMNIYLISPTGYNPHLQFSINGQLIGTDVLLNEWTNSDDNPWLEKFRFWGEWNSGSATTAVVQIRDLETSYNQNDFGLDDISFGTLAPRPAEVDPGSAGDICEGETISLYANPQYGREPITFLWTGPNGFTSTDENPLIPNATTASSGTYTVQVSDAYGCENKSASVDVTVYSKIEVDAGADQEVCSESPTVILSGSVTGGATTGSWSGGDGLFNPNAQTLNASYTPSSAEIAAGNVTLTLTSDTPDGPCPVQSDELTIVIHQSPEISLNATPPLCNGGRDGKIEAIVTGGQSPYSYLWDDGQTTATAVGLKAGSHSVTVTDANGCSATGTITLTEPDKFVVNPLTYTVPTCYGATDGSATITASGGTPPYQFIWDANTGSQTTATATGLGAGTYSVIVLSDSRGCAATAVNVTIPEPEAPELSCPKDIHAVAEEGQAYASNVPVPAPEYDTFCQAIEYEMTGATTGAGYGLVPSPSTFNVGTTTITYTAVNLKGEPIECDFRVIVSDTKPDISCADPVSVDTDADQCSASASISLPGVNSGTGINWTWTMTGATTDQGSGPIPSPYTFNKGVTTILWTATNGAGSAQCSQTVTVTDKQSPDFSAPDPVEVCMEYLKKFSYTSQIKPDYYTFENGNTILDLNVASFSDNCGFSDCSPRIEWRIVFYDGSKLPVSGYFTGQPSAYNNNGSTSFRFPGDHEGGSLLTHTIYYRITDCSNNLSSELSTTITVSPRPEIILHLP